MGDKFDKEAEALEEEWRIRGTPIIAARLRADGEYIERLEYGEDRRQLLAERYGAQRACDALQTQLAQAQAEITALRAQLAAANKYAHWFKEWPSYTPNPDRLDECVQDRDAWLAANREEPK